MESGNVSFLTKEDSNALKGFAILLVLFHHLFYNHPEISINIMGINVLNKAAILGKVSVAIFIILSGFGLSESCKNKEIDLGKFYLTRLSNLYIRYWIIFIISLLAGTYIFNYSPSQVYGNQVQYKMFIEAIGFHMFSFGYGYNATWWFMTLIITLYLLFPILLVLTRTFKWIMLIFGYQFMMSETIINNAGWLSPYVSSFIVGIFLSVAISDELKGRLGKLLSSNFTAFIVLIALILLTAYQRFQYYFADVYVDFIFGTLILFAVWVIIRKIKWINKTFSVFGTYSFEIFLIHSFIYYYFFPKIIYGLKNPILMYLVLAAFSLLISVALHKLCNVINMKVMKRLSQIPLNTHIKF